MRSKALQDIRKRVSGAGIFEQVGCSIFADVCYHSSREVLKWQKPSDSIS